VRKPFTRVGHLPTNEEVLQSGNAGHLASAFPPGYCKTHGLWILTAATTPCSEEAVANKELETEQQTGVLLRAGKPKARALGTGSSPGPVYHREDWIEEIKNLKNRLDNWPQPQKK